MIAIFGSLIFSDGVFSWYGPSEFGSWDEICPAKSTWQNVGASSSTWNNVIKDANDWESKDNSQGTIKRCKDAN